MVGIKRSTPPTLQKCKCCGREFSIEHFTKSGFGIHKTCKECESKNRKANLEKKRYNNSLEKQLEEAKTLRLSSFTPRELMAELKRRGFEGKLTYTETHEIDITKM